MKTSSRNSSNNPKRPAWIFAIAILLLGALLGYLFRGTSSSTASAGSLKSNQPTGSASSPGSGLSLQATVQPLLDRLKDSPNDPELLTNIGNTYYDNHDYSKAVEYYEQSLKLRPEDVNVRMDMGTAIWYSGNADGAIREYQTSLQYQPNHAQTLFNMGIVEWQGKHDDNSALQWWQKLLAENPAYPDRQKVEQLMQQVQSEMAQSSETPIGR
jgi:cytochrome c-type biogenesis protein CcmH/NrfG